MRGPYEMGCRAASPFLSADKKSAYGSFGLVLLAFLRHSLFGQERILYVPADKGLGHWAVRSQPAPGETTRLVPSKRNSWTPSKSTANAIALAAAPPGKVSTA